MSVTIKYTTDLPAADPDVRPITIVGKKPNLSQVSFTKVASHLGKGATEDTWKAAVGSLSTVSVSSCSVWLNKATVAGIPTQVSRHNTPSRAHALTKAVEAGAKSGDNVAILVVCERSEMMASACAVARAYPTYTMKTATKLNQTVTVGFCFVGESPAPVSEEDVKCLDALCEGVRLAQAIVDKPTNFMHTDSFLDVIRSVGKDAGIEPMIIQGEDLDKQGFGGIYGVGKAAVHQPALAVLSHTPPGATETICWAGKGIVYDTGGLSIKTKTGMPGMKRDCGGAAGILGAFQVAVKMGFKQNLHAVFCLAENAVGPNATRPDDIHTLYSGKTVEINNTDAEGRLVLGDGVAYCRKVLKADWVVDMATLTGAQGISTGLYHAGVVTNCEASETAVQQAGRVSGDLTFPLPYSPELHFSEFRSAVADMKNSVADRGNAQSSCAGLFIGAHLGFDYPGVWIHIDMASPVHCGERATGYGVALLNTMYGDRSDSPLLQSVAPNMKKT